MKFKNVSDPLSDALDEFFELDENFINKDYLATHYNKHVVNNNRNNNVPNELKFGNISMDQYEQIANSLALQPVDYKTILGYVQRNVNKPEQVSYIKYNKADNTLVSFIENDKSPIIITCFKRGIRDYECKKYMTDNWEYIDEIPKGE